MTAFTATFANGQTITRNSRHDYKFAWAIFHAAGRITDKGFSADRANAAKAAASALPRFLSERDRKHPAITRHHAKMAKEQGFANVDALRKHWDDETAARRAELRTEIVAVAIA